MRRKVVKIDEEKCDGCGQCVSACAEGAIQIINGKAKLIGEQYCDGLGACLGECPRGAISVEEREAEQFDPQAVQRRKAQTGQEAAPKGCPGALTRFLQEKLSRRRDDQPGSRTPSSLANWPVQIHLVPVRAPYLQGAKLLVASDCVPFAYADFHRKLLAGRVLLVGCPKLDDAEAYRRKLADIFRENPIESVEVAYMEVPCCGGMVRIVAEALERSGQKIPLKLCKIGIDGRVIESEPAGHAAAK